MKNIILNLIADYRVWRLERAMRALRATATKLRQRNRRIILDQLADQLIEAISYNPPPTPITPPKTKAEALAEIRAEVFSPPTTTELETMCSHLEQKGMYA